MLEAKNISLSFNRQPIILDASVQILEGQKIALLGASGAGKTTLLKILAGLLAPNKGGVFCDGVQRNFSETTVSNSSNYPKWVWSTVTLAFQNHRLFPNLTAQENCLLGLSSKNEKPYAKLFELTQILAVEHCLGKKPREMSQGEQQRISIIRTLIREPKYLLLDEPTASLDPLTRKKLVELLKTFKDMAILFSTHDWEFASKLAEGFLTIRQPHLSYSKDLYEAVDSLTV